MNVAVVLSERQMVLIHNFSRMNVKGQNLLLKMSDGFTGTFPLPTAKVIPFVRPEQPRQQPLRQPK
jgi:hypothetical protein